MNLRGNVTTEQMLPGFVFWESEMGCSYRMVVTEAAQLVEQEDSGFVQWQWKATDANGRVVDYLATEGLAHYGSQMHDYPPYEETMPSKSAGVTQDDVIKALDQIFGFTKKEENQ